MKTSFQTRLAAAAARRGLSFSWQPLKYGYQRAVFSCDSFEAFVRIRSLMERMKDASVETWKCDDGNVFEGYVYVMDAAERRTLQAISDAEAAKRNEWWQRYHAADDSTRRLMASGKIL